MTPFLEMFFWAINIIQEKGRSLLFIEKSVKILKIQGFDKSYMKEN